MLKHLAILAIFSGFALAQGPAFPGHIATDEDLYVASDNVQTTLTSPLSGSDSTIQVASGSRFAAFNIASIDQELIKICSVSGNTLTVCTGGRGWASTTAVSHITGARISVFVSATYHNILTKEIESIENWIWDGIGNTIKVFNVQHYGAAGTGSGDDTTSFQTAITNASSSGGIVYMPCGTYPISSTLVISSQNVSMWGASEHCVVLEYLGTGRLLDVVDLPPTGGPHGEYKNFTISMPNAIAGTIGMMSETSNALYENLQVTTCKLGTGFYISNGALTSGMSSVSYEEKNHWINVNDDHCAVGWHVGLTGGSPPSTNFIQYNFFDNISGSASLGQVVFKLDPGPIFYHNNVSLTCKLDNQDSNSLGSTLPSTCIYSDGNWKYGEVRLNGEWNNSVGTGTGVPYSITVTSGSTMLADNGYASIYFIPGLGGAAVPINNLAGFGAVSGLQIGMDSGTPRWYMGSGSPSNPCSNGDVYTDRSTGKLYVCEATTWSMK